MDIYLELSARAYIAKKSLDKSITLGVGKREGANCGCSVGGGTFPTVKLGVSPFDIDSYNKANMDGISIYYPSSVANVFKAVTVKVEGILFYKQLLALGS
jgi:hypothetical protein